MVQGVGLAACQTAWGLTAWGSLMVWEREALHKHAGVSYALHDTVATMYVGCVSPIWARPTDPILARLPSVASPAAVFQLAGYDAGLEEGSNGKGLFITHGSKKFVPTPSLGILVSRLVLASCTKQNGVRGLALTNPQDRRSESSSHHGPI